MRSVLLIAVLVPLAACSTGGPAPSLATRPAEAIDPRVPVNRPVEVGTVDPALAGLLAAAVAKAQDSQPEFDVRTAAVQKLAPGAGPMGSESWIAAQAALSRLVEQQGVATNAAADIDTYAGIRLDGQRWLNPASQRAIAEASAHVATVTAVQAAVVADLTAQLSR